MVTKEEFTEALKATLDALKEGSESNKETTQRMVELLSKKDELPEEVLSFCKQYPELCKQQNARLDRLTEIGTSLVTEKDNDHSHSIEEALSCPTCSPQWLGELERLGYSKAEEEGDGDSEGKLSSPSSALFDANDKRLWQWGLAYGRDADFVEDGDKVKVQFLGKPEDFKEKGCQLVCDEDGCNWVCETK